jgi:hypothetical protein
MPAPILQFKRGNAAALSFGLRAGEPAVTLDTNDFYVGIDSTLNNNKFYGSSRYWTKETSSTGSGVNLVEGTSNGSDFITLAAPATVGAAVTYYFPASQGNASSVLTNDGSGNLTWASGSANPVFSGIATFTDTTNNDLGDANTGAVQIDGGLGINKNTTIGENLNVQGYSQFVGVVTVADLYVDSTRVLYDDGSGITLAGIQTIDATTKQTLEEVLSIEPNNFSSLNVSGISTFGGLVDANGGLDVSGQVIFNNDLEITGVSTFTSDIDANGNLDVDGFTELDDVNVSGTFNVVGVSTFTGLIESDGGIDVTGHSELDDVNVSVALTSAELNVTGNTILGDASADTLTVNATATFGPSITGTISTATRATTVDTTASSTNSAHYLTFVDSSSSTEGETINVDSDISYNPSTNVLSVPAVNTGSIRASDGTSSLTINDSTGNVVTSSNLTVSGNLYVNGSTTQINTTELTINDRTITLGIQTGSTPTTTTWDLGVMMNYGDVGIAKTAGVIWDYSAERFVFSADSDNPISEGNTSSPVITVSAYSPIEIGALWVNDCAGQSQVISCTGSERFLENITVDAGTF